MTSELQTQHSSSRNGERHALLSSFVVLRSEDPAHFQKLIVRLYEELQPQSRIEEDLVETMAVARWRQTRLWIIEKATFDREIQRENEQAHAAGHHPITLCSLAFRTLGEDSRTLDLINRDESRFDRQYLRAHKRLLDLRKLRGPCQPDSNPPNEPKPASADSTPVIPISAKRTQQPVENKPSTPASRPWRSHRKLYAQLHKLSVDGRARPNQKIDGSADPPRTSYTV